MSDRSWLDWSFGKDHKSDCIYLPKWSKQSSFDAVALAALLDILSNFCIAELTLFSTGDFFLYVPVIIDSIFFLFGGVFWRSVSFDVKSCSSFTSTCFSVLLFVCC